MRRRLPAAATSDGEAGEAKLKGGKLVRCPLRLFTTSGPVSTVSTLVPGTRAGFTLIGWHRDREKQGHCTSANQPTSHNMNWPGSCPRPSWFCAQRVCVRLSVQLACAFSLFLSSCLTARSWFEVWSTLSPCFRQKSCIGGKEPRSHQELEALPRCTWNQVATKLTPGFVGSMLICRVLGLAGPWIGKNRTGLCFTGLEVEKPVKFVGVRTSALAFGWKIGPKGQGPWVQAYLTLPPSEVFKRGAFLFDPSLTLWKE